MTVSKEQNGTWRVDISNKNSPIHGRRLRHRKKGFKTKTEALQYEAEYRILKFNDTSQNQKVSITLLYSLLKEEDQLRGNKQGTVDTQDSYFNTYTSIYFKDSDMNLLTNRDIKKYRDWLQKSPSIKGGNLSNSHVNQQMIFLHKLYEVGISHGILLMNPCNNLKRLPEKHKEMDYYTPEEFKVFDSYFTKDEYNYQLLYRVLMYTGTRIGEALALTWKDINFEENAVNISKTAYFRNNKVYIGTVKTTQSNRTVYIHKGFVEELSNWKEKQAILLSEFTNDFESLQIYQNSPFLLTAPNIANFRIMFKKRLPKNFKLIRNHDFRHSHSAFLISEGLRNGEGKDYLFFLLMKRLGHSSINTTINTYSHLFPSQQKEVANAFDNF